MRCDRVDCLGIVCRDVSGLTAGIDDLFMGVEDRDGELVGAKTSPDVFDRMGIDRRRVDLRHDTCCGPGTVGTDSPGYAGRPVSGVARRTGIRCRAAHGYQVSRGARVSGVARRAWAGATIGPHGSDTARTRVRVPCWPTRASFWSRTSSRSLIFAAAARNSRAVKSVRATCTVIKTPLASQQENQIGKPLDIPE